MPWKHRRFFSMLLVAFVCVHNWSGQFVTVRCSLIAAAVKLIGSSVFLESACDAVSSDHVIAKRIQPCGSMASLVLVILEIYCYFSFLSNVLSFQWHISSLSVTSDTNVIVSLDWFRPCVNAWVLICVCTTSVLAANFGSVIEFHRCHHVPFHHTRII